MLRPVRIAAAAFILSGCFEPLVKLAGDAGSDAGPLACMGGLEGCGGRCVNLRIDDDHCGLCDRPCGSDRACGGGMCHPRDCLEADCSADQVCLNDRCSDKACV